MSKTDAKAVIACAKRPSYREHFGCETHIEIGLLKLGPTFNEHRIARLIEKPLRKLAASPFVCESLKGRDASNGYVINFALKQGGQA